MNYPRLNGNFSVSMEYCDAQPVTGHGKVDRGGDHESQGRRVHGCKDGDPGVWQWKFRIGDETKTGKTETKIDLLAIRRVQLRIDRELKAIGQRTA